MAGGFGLNEALSALGGAGVAFASNAVADKIARHRNEADHGNGALMTLAQMYSQLQNMWRQSYSEFAAQHGVGNRRPLPIEIRPMTKVADDGLRLSLSDVSFLMRSHDPDLPNRLATVEAQFLQHRESENERTRLALDMQEALAKAGIRPGPIDVRRAEEICGPALWNQLVAITAHQYEKLPKTIANVLAVQKQLRNVMRFQFPMRRFILWEPRDEAKLASALENPDTPEPAWWRAKLRNLVDLYRKWRTKKKSPTSKVTT